MRSSKRVGTELVPVGESGGLWGTRIQVGGGLTESGLRGGPRGPSRS